MTSPAPARRKRKTASKARRYSLPPPSERDRRFFHQGLDKWMVNVPAEAFYATGEDEVIFTTLGSCVSACVHDPVLGIGGLNHFLLPRQPAEGSSNAALRYGCQAMEQLLNRLFQMGASRAALETKVFGGGASDTSTLDVGSANVAFVMEYLDNEGMLVVGSDVGGKWARQVRYYARTGRALVRRISMLRRPDVIDEERRLLSDVALRPGAIELF